MSPRQYDFSEFKPKKLKAVRERIERESSNNVIPIRPTQLERLIYKILHRKPLRVREIKKLAVVLGDVVEEIEIRDKTIDPLTQIIELITDTVMNNRIDYKDMMFISNGCLATTYHQFRNKRIVELAYRYYETVKEAIDQDSSGQMELILQETWLQYFNKNNFNIISALAKKYIERSILLQKIEQPAEFDNTAMITEEMAIRRTYQIEVVKQIDLLLPIKNTGIDFQLFHFVHSLNLWIEDKIEVYISFLRYYKNSNEPAIKLSKFWMDKILSDMGEPNGKQRGSNWEKVPEDIVQYFNEWYIMQKLEEYFIGKVNDRRRLNFWNRYAHEISDLFYHEASNQAILMELKRGHTIVEFGIPGNACYFYKNEKFDIAGFKERIRKYPNSNYVFHLKNQEINIARYNHSGAWEYRFSDYLGRLGYRRS